MSKTYLDGLKQAHKVAMGTLPLPCGNKKKRDALIGMGTLMGIPIKAIEREIEKESKKQQPVADCDICRMPVHDDGSCGCDGKNWRTR